MAWHICEGQRMAFLVESFFSFYLYTGSRYQYIRLRWQTPLLAEPPCWPKAVFPYTSSSPSPSLLPSSSVCPQFRLTGWSSFGMDLQSKESAWKCMSRFTRCSNNGMSWGTKARGWWPSHLISFLALPFLDLRSEFRREGSCPHSAIIYRL